MPLAANQVLHGCDLRSRSPGADLELAEMQPEFAGARAAERDRDGDGIVARGRLLDKADDLVVVDRGKAHIAGLQQCRILPAQPVEATNIVLDVARLVPVAGLELVFFRMQVFLATGNRRVLDELEPAVDAIARPAI